MLESTRSACHTLRCWASLPLQNSIQAAKDYIDEYNEKRAELILALRAKYDLLVTALANYADKVRILNIFGGDWDY